MSAAIMLGRLLGTILLLLPLSAGSADEKKLFSDLFNGYVPEVRPRHDHRQPVVVTIDFDLNKQEELAEKTQVLSTVGFFEAEWYDDYATWNPDDYDGIREIVIPPQHIWLPDIGIVNSVNDFYKKIYFEYFRVRVNYTGQVHWAFGGPLATSCDVDANLYPFDFQRCSIRLGNWQYTINQVDLVNRTSSVRLDGFEADGVWKLVTTKVRKQTVKYETDPDRLFPILEYQLYLQRKPRHYLITIVTPCIILVAIALLVYWIPTEAGEKISLSVTVVLAFSVVQLVIADSVPENSDCVPLLRSTSPVPRLIRVVAFDFVARALCISLPPLSGKSGQKLGNKPKDDAEDAVPLNGGCVKSGGLAGGHEDCSQCRALSGRVDELTVELRKVTARLEAQDEETALADEWRALAKVVDRLLFWVTLIILIVVLLWLMLSSKEHHTFHIDDD